MSTISASAVGVSAAAISAQPGAGGRLGVMSRTPLISVSARTLSAATPKASDETPGPLRRGFTGIRDAFPDADGTRAEVAWSALHGLATLQASGRLRASHVQARLDLAHRMLTQQESH